MYLLYLDESGHPSDAASDFFVIAGISVFERQTHWIDAAINPIATRFNPDNPRAIEFHGAPMRGGREDWHGISPADRVQALVDVLSVLRNKQAKPRVFAAVLEKKLVEKSNILSTAFEMVVAEFDRYLGSMHLRKNTQRGLVIFDRNAYEEKIQALSNLFKHEGHANGKLRNFAEVPLFLDSRASRLIQMADLVAYWIYRYYNADDARGMDLIRPCIHAYNGEPHGLMTLVSPETAARVENLPQHEYPFPPPSVGNVPEDNNSKN